MINGILNIYKEKGYTSHDVVAKLRGIIGQKKIGHTGTLDPDATGVLPVCIGKATKVCDLLTEKDKTYEAVMKLGVTTDTQDATGVVLKTSEVSLDKCRIIEVIESFIGEYMQIPPMFSALKVNGKKLYELAREGKEVERAPRQVWIRSIDLIEFISDTEIKLLVTCSKGTYIRTLCHDIGEKLGCGACMQSLIRTQVGRFNLEDSITLVEVKEHIDAQTLNEKIVKVDDLFPKYDKVYIGSEYNKVLYNGNKITTEMFQTSEIHNCIDTIRVYDSESNFIGIYEVHQELNKELNQEEQEKIICYKPLKLFFIS